MISNYKVIIIGAGPAGLQLSYFLNKANISHIVIERSEIAGSFFRTYPVHRNLISINKINTGFSDKQKNLRWDWNSLLNEDDDNFLFKDFDHNYYPSSDNLVNYLGEFASKYKLPIKYNTEVVRIAKSDDKFTIECINNKKYESEVLVDATGIAQLNVPKIMGIEHAIPYSSMSNDTSRFKNKRILIIGKGNSAFETADSLLETSSNIHLISPDDFTFAWVSHYPGHLRSINQSFLDTFFLKQQNAILNGTIESIQKSESGQYLVDITFSEDGEQELNTYDYVINCSGFKCDFSHYSADIQPELCLGGMFPKLNHLWESANITDLFFCGSNMQCNDYKDSSTPFIHGIRHNAEFLSKIIINKLYNSTIAIDEKLQSRDEIYDVLSDRIKRATPIWFLFGNVYDLIKVNESGGYDFFGSIPKLVFKNDTIFEHFTGYILEFSYRLPKDNDEKLKFSQHGFLHPIICKYKESQLIDEIHMLEDIYGDWEDLNKLDNGIKRFILSGKF